MIRFVCDVMAAWDGRRKGTTVLSQVARLLFLLPLKKGLSQTELSLDYRRKATGWGYWSVESLAEASLSFF